MSSRLDLRRRRAATIDLRVSRTDDPRSTLVAKSMRVGLRRNKRSDLSPHPRCDRVPPVGAWLAKQEGRSQAEGAIVGAVLGILGILVLGLAPSATGPTRKCPQRAEQVLAAAKVCRYCGTALEPVDHVVTKHGMSPTTFALLSWCPADGVKWHSNSCPRRRQGPYGYGRECSDS